MDNSTIYRENNNTSAASVEALNKFYSVRRSISSVKGVATDRPYYKKIIPLQRNISEDINSRLTDLAEGVSSVRISYISYNLSITLSEINSLPFTLNYSRLLQSAIYNRNSIEERGKSRNIGVKIEEYFSRKPSERSQLRGKYATYIRSTQDVFYILDCGNARNFVDAYDGAADLLAECDEDIISNAVKIAREKYISTNNVEIAQSWEKNWDILIKAVSCGLKIEPFKRWFLLFSLCDPKNKLSRLMKLSLIDATVDLDLEPEFIMIMLQIFMSERESDDFVRNYASEQAEECL